MVAGGGIRCARGLVPGIARFCSRADYHPNLSIRSADRPDPDRGVRRTGPHCRAVRRVSRFEQRTFLAYGIGLLPFFVFDYWFYVVVPMLTWVGLLDVVGNVVMMGACVAGWQAAGRDI